MQDSSILPLRPVDRRSPDSGTATANRCGSVRFLLDHYVEVLTVLTLLFVLQTGLVPFDFASSVQTGDRGPFSFTVSRLTFPDVVSNIFLYFPLGMLAHWSLCRLAGSGRLVFPATVALACTVSAGVEWLQAYSPSRVSSLIDLVSNVLGASLGAGVSTLARWIVPRMVGAALAELHERPLPALLKCYVVALVVVALIPFSFSIDRVRLKQSVQAINWIPFAQSIAQAEPGELPLPRIETDRQRWDRMKRWSRWTAECASFTVLACLLIPVLRDHYGFRRFGTYFLTAWTGTGLAFGLSAAQFPIVSRACDVTDVIFRILGLGFGSALLIWYRSCKGRLSERRLTRLKRELAAIVCAAVTVFVFYNGLIPLRFSGDLGGPARSLAADGFLPFFAYFLARFDIMMGDALEKFVSYALLAATLTAFWEPVCRRSAAARLVRVTGICLVTSFVIEVAQMFIPVRVTSLTDPILAAAGAMVGVLGQRNASRFYRFATSRDETVAPLAPLDDRPSVPSTTDELIGTLIDPFPGAPKEAAPTPGLQPARDGT